jgi:hypothetical protein
MYIRIRKEFELAKYGHFQPFWAKGFHRFKFDEVSSDRVVAHKFANHLIILLISRVTI